VESVFVITNVASPLVTRVSRDLLVELLGVRNHRESEIRCKRRRQMPSASRVFDHDDIAGTDFSALAICYGDCSATTKHASLHCDNITSPETELTSCWCSARELLRNRCMKQSK
jgi:hypothetical protein